VGGSTVRVNQSELRKKQIETAKKPFKKSKPSKRKIDLKSSDWYQTTMLSVGIPLDRREQR
jgi:hypothetical protein